MCRRRHKLKSQGDRLNAVQPAERLKAVEQETGKLAGIILDGIEIKRFGRQLSDQRKS